MSIPPEQSFPSPSAPLIEGSVEPLQMYGTPAPMMAPIPSVAPVYVQYPQSDPLLKWCVDNDLEEIYYGLKQLSLDSLEVLSRVKPSEFDALARELKLEWGKKIKLVQAMEKLTGTTTIVVSPPQSLYEEEKPSLAMSSLPPGIQPWDHLPTWDIQFPGVEVYPSYLHRIQALMLSPAGVFTLLSEQLRAVQGPELCIGITWPGINKSGTGNKNYLELNLKKFLGKKLDLTPSEDEWRACGNFLKARKEIAVYSARARAIIDTASFDPLLQSIRDDMKTEKDSKGFAGKFATYRVEIKTPYNQEVETVFLERKSRMSMWFEEHQCFWITCLVFISLSFLIFILAPFWPCFDYCCDAEGRSQNQKHFHFVMRVPVETGTGERFLEIYKRGGGGMRSIQALQECL